MSDSHFLENLADELGTRMQELVDAKAEALRGPGGRPLFTRQMAKSQALAWWRQHRYDDIGKGLVAQMEPQDVLELDQALSQANAAAMMGPERW
jgi:hypothetical protein